MPSASLAFIGKGVVRFRPLKRAAASTRSMGQVRIILTDDLPNGKAYRGDVVEVKAGYARNYLIPQKKALYAVRQNFERLGMKDPDHESPQQRAERLVREGAESDDHDLKAADQLKHYLRNKVLKIWRNVDSVTENVSPGFVGGGVVRKKLSKQLGIDLEPHEKVFLHPDPVSSHADLTDKDVLEIMEKIDSSSDADPSKIQIRQLGEFMAKISLKGGHSVPLKFEVRKR